MDALPPGNPFPALELQDDRGQPAKLPFGETLYVFFKTTCPTCSFSWPFVSRLEKTGREGALQILGVSQDDPLTTARFSGDLGADVPILYDPAPWKASEAVGLTNVPTFFLVGTDGIVRDTVVGFQRDKLEDFAKLAARSAQRPEKSLFEGKENVPAMKAG